MILGLTAVYLIAFQLGAWPAILRPIAVDLPDAMSDGIGACPPSAITLHVEPRIAMAPATVHLEIHVSPEPSDRVIEVSARDEDGFLARLSGFIANPRQRVYVVDWSALAAGEYEVAATIRGSRHAQSTRTFLLILE